MHSPVMSFSRQSSRERHRRRLGSSRTQPPDELLSVVTERPCPIKIRRRRALAALSFYDNNEVDESEHIYSKWTIVRQRLPDILALSTTYKPATVRAQLVLLIALMNKQAPEDTDETFKLKRNEYNNTISHIVPSTVIVDISGRNRLIRLKHIPSEQYIHVDIDSLSFSIPTRQFILAISRGQAHETAGKYCPPAVSEMLINLSKIKFVDDRRQYERAQFKMHLGQILFFAIFILLFAMMCALLIAVTHAVYKINADNYTLPFTSMQSVVSGQHYKNHPGRTKRDADYW